MRTQMKIKMKRTVSFFISLLSVFVVYGAADSAKVVLFTLSQTSSNHTTDNDAMSTDISIGSIAVHADMENPDFTAPLGASLSKMGGGITLGQDSAYGHFCDNTTCSALTKGNCRASVDNDDAASSQDLNKIFVKTNLLYDAALLPNVEAEWRFDREWSVALECGIAWWGRYSRNRSYRLAMISPEVKRWFHPGGKWNDIYIGAFAGAGLYDFQKGARGDRGEGLMAGLSIGYMWPIKRCLSLETALGAGYLYTKYKKYHPVDGHHVYLRTKDISYFGPLKVKLALVWRLWDVGKRGNSKKQSVPRYEK